MKTTLPSLLAVMALSLLAVHPRLAAQTFGTLTTLHEFEKVGQGPDGAYPEGGLVDDGSGNFYGSASTGGTNGNGAGYGTIFRVNAAGEFAVLHSFSPLKHIRDHDYNSDGSQPVAALVPDGEGNFLGTARLGGSKSYGTIFRITPAGEFTVLYSLDNDEGSYPSAPLTRASDGNFYGTTQQGGGLRDGAIFRISPQGEFTKLYRFSGPTGARCNGGLTEGRDGKFYGVATYGGGTNLGTVYRVTPAGVVTRAHDFQGPGPEGANPSGELAMASDGSFYGSATGGGTNATGTVFRVTPEGRYTVMHQFSAVDENGYNADGANPGTLMLARDGNFYGMTSLGGHHGQGVIFRLSPQGGFAPVYYFGGTDGRNPNGRLVQGSDGNFYGMTVAGGRNNQGTVFQFIAPPVPFITSAAMDTATVGRAYQYQITATNGPTSFAAVNLPPGLTLDQTTGLISGTPTGDAATYTVTLKATNASGTGQQTLTLSVVGVPVITSADTASVTVGVVFSYQIVAKNNPTNFYAGKLPPGIGVNASTGLVSGKTKQAGTFNVTLYARNATGTGTAPLTITVGSN